jgi:hypothetical protein
MFRKWVRCDEHRYAVYKAAAGVDGRLGVKFGGCLRTDRQVVNDSFCPAVFEYCAHIDRFLAIVYRYQLSGVFVYPVKARAAADLDAHFGHLGEHGRVVRRGVNRFGDVLAYFVAVHVEGGYHFYVADVVTAKVYMHDAGDEFVVTGVFIIVDSLH